MTGAVRRRSGRGGVGARPAVLIISPNVPAQDQSSGDLRLFSMCRLLALQYDVVLASMNRRPGSEDERYVREAENVGVEIVLPRWSLRHVLGCRPFEAVMMEFFHTAEHYLRAVRILRPDCAILVDSVDVHFHRERLKSLVTGRPEDRRKAVETERREMRTYREADSVIAVTHEDAGIIVKQDPSVRCNVVPNIHEIVECDRRGHQKDTLLFVGNFHHEPNSDAVAYFCQDIMPLIHRRRPSVRLTIVGMAAPESVTRFSSPPVEFVGLVPSVTPYLASARISIAPLRFGAGMKGKIGQSMAHGVPVVTTSVGAQGFGLTPGKNVLIGDTAEAFASAVLRLLDDDALHEDLAAESVEFIRQRFTPEKAAESISRMVEESLEGGVKAVRPLARLACLSEYMLGRVKRPWRRRARS